MAAERRGGNQLVGVPQSSLDNPQWSQTITGDDPRDEDLRRDWRRLLVASGAHPGRRHGRHQRRDLDRRRTSSVPATATRSASMTRIRRRRSSRSAGDDYPGSLISYRTLVMPQTAARRTLAPSSCSRRFTASDRSRRSACSRSTEPSLLVRQSPYARAYALALAARAQVDDARTRSCRASCTTCPTGSPTTRTAPHQYPLESFLFKDKFGYCQQFAGAMALLLRMGGIPARVAVGFTTGNYDNGAHDYVVGDVDAHAWVEAWFPRYGWVRFDPTPAVAPARGGKSRSSRRGSRRRPPDSRGPGPRPRRADRCGGGRSQASRPYLAAVLDHPAGDAGGVGGRAAVRHPGAEGAVGRAAMLAELEPALARSGRPSPPA